MLTLEPLGDQAVLASFTTEAEASLWAQAIREANLPGVLDVSLAYATAAVYGDSDQVLDWQGWVKSLLGVKVPDPTDRPPARTLVVPVWYDGPDLAEVAATLGMTEAEVVALHSGQTYQVFAIGFQPGFPYLGYLPERLSGLPRRSSPRPRVPAGSVAIAGRQTGIYPGESPGGWHLLGRTPCLVVDVEGGVFPIEPGDWLRFKPISRVVFGELACRKKVVGEPFHC